MRTASFASRAPLVFGKSRNFFGSMKSRILAYGSCLPERSARRNATVTISVPLASIASRIASFEENLPVPTSSRDENSRSAIFSLDGLSDMAQTYARSHHLRMDLYPHGDCANLAACTALSCRSKPSDPAIGRLVQARSLGFCASRDD